MDKTLRISAAGISFNAGQRGDNPRTLFIHGFSGDLHTWDAVWDELGDDFPALRYDLRGFGLSPCKSSQAFSHADDLVAILDELGIERCQLVGVSMGGAIALNAALNVPERVEKLVLINPGLVAWEWSAEWKALWRPIVTSARAGNMAQARELWWQHPLFATTRESPGASNLYQSIMAYSGEQWIKDYERPELPDVERLYSLKVPTLLLTGERDLDDFRLVASLLEASAAQLTRVDFPGRGHLLNLEDPAGCTGKILSFLR
jgi:pimeloyl-ACP methyl ester carboxylesterase